MESKDKNLKDDKTNIKKEVPELIRPEDIKEAVKKGDKKWMND